MARGHNVFYNSYILFFNFLRHPRQRFREIREMFSSARAEVSFEVSLMPAKLKEWLLETNYPLEKLLKKEVDLYFSPFFSGIAKNGYKKNVVTIHDLAFLDFPEHRGKDLSNYYLKKTTQAVKSCQKIIAVSQATKEDLIKKLKVPQGKIEVIYEGVSSEFQPRFKKDDRNIIKKYLKKDQQYILSICTLEPRKNLPRLIRAYSLLNDSLKKEYKLVLTGNRGWREKEIYREIKSNNLEDEVILTGYVAQEHLPALYRKASVFVYPSLYEGFGLPPLEAMKSGTPVISSKISSLPEVIGKAGVLINPYQEIEIANGILKILNDKKFARSLSKRGVLQAKKFSWEKTAKETINLFSKIK